MSHMIYFWEKQIDHEVFGLFWITVQYAEDVNESDGSEDLDFAGEGRYRATIVDFHCAEVKVTYELVCECAPCEIDATLQEPSCLGDDGGSIMIQMLCEAQGHEPFQAKWGDGETGLSRNNLTPGRYCVTVFDSGN